MSVYKKINKETGNEELRYIVYENRSSNLFYELCNMGHFAEDTDLTELEYTICVEIFNNNTYIIFINDEKEVEFCTHIAVGDIVAPYRFTWEMHNDNGNVIGYEIDFSKARTYTTDELEELYPSEKYDTVVVLE